jgi:hypothetical protein
MMLKKNLYLCTSLLVVMGMLAFTNPAFALTGTRHVRGKVVAINRRTHVMTVRNVLGRNVKLRFNALTTRLWHNGVRIRLANLHVGNQVNASFTPSTTSGVPGTADDVDDNEGQNDISGTVAAVDTTLNTVSIATEDGGSTVILTVNSSTVITRNGAPATLADLIFGDKIEAQYDSATMIASSINAEADMQEGEVEGSITAVDATAGTITISGEGSSGGGDSMSSTDVTLNVTTTTVVMLNGSPAPLSSLQVGMQAEAKYDPTTMNASFVEAETQ